MQSGFKIVSPYRLTKDGKRFSAVQEVQGDCPIFRPPQFLGRFQAVAKIANLTETSPLVPVTFKDPKRPKCVVNAQFIFDTGAASSIVSRTMLERLRKIPIWAPLNLSEDEHGVRFRSVTGEVNFELFTLTMFIGSKKIRTPVVVVDEFTEDGLIGMPLIHQLGLNFDHKTEQFFFEDGTSFKAAAEQTMEDGKQILRFSSSWKKLKSVVEEIGQAKRELYPDLPDADETSVRSFGFPRNDDLKSDFSQIEKEIDRLRDEATEINQRADSLEKLMRAVENIE